MEDFQGRKKQQRPGSISTCNSKQDQIKEVRFQSDEASSQQSSQGSTSQDQAKPKKTVKKGSRYLLACDVDNTIEEDEIAKKF